MFVKIKTVHSLDRRLNMQMELKMSTPYGAPVQHCNQLNSCNITYMVRCNQTVTKSKNIPNTLGILLNSATELVYPEKLTNAKTSLNKLKNYLINYFE